MHAQPVAAPAGSPSRTAHQAAAAAPAARRRLITVVAFVIALLACMAASLAVGTRPIALPEVWSALVSPTGTDNETVVRSLRVPRTLLGLVVGAALGLAGALVQGHTRNPLADPGLLGVSAGAAFAVVVAITTTGVTGVLGYVWFAFAGALAASVLVFGIGAAAARQRAATTPVTLALAGAAVSALLGGLTNALVLADTETLDAYRFWVVGSLAGRGTDVLLPVLPFLAVGALLAVAQAPVLNALNLGADVARALGVRTARARAVGITAITLLTGAAVAACGPIAFVGLVVPHVMRMLTGLDHRWSVPLSALLGAVLLLAADVAGRVAARPGEVQVGITVALLGAPFFIALVRRRRLVVL